MAALQRIVQQYGTLHKDMARLLQQEQKEQDEVTLALHDRLLQQFSSLYLTLLSIIQGVAFAYFAEQLSARAGQLTLTVWIEAAATLLTIIFMWYEWSMTTLVSIWVPGFFDAAIPFIFGAVELYVAHSLAPDATVWLGASSLTTLMGCVSYVYATHQAGAHRHSAREYHSRSVPSYVGIISATVLNGAIFALAAAHILDPTSWLGPAISLAYFVLFLLIRMRHWDEVVRRREAGTA